MAPKLVVIMLLITVARTTISAKITDYELGNNSTFTKDEYNTPLQNIVKIKIDHSMPVVIKLENIPAIEDTVENVLSKLESKLLQRLDNIVQKLDSIVNSTCDKLNKQPLDGNIWQNPITNQSLTDIIWSECKHEVVKNTEADYDYSLSLRPIASAALRHVSLRSAGGRTEYLHMRLGLQASWRGQIILSPVRDLKDRKFYFMIAVYKNEVYFGTVNEQYWKELERVNTTTALSASQPTALLLTVSNNTLQLRHASTDAPFLEYHHERFGDIKYIGFVSMLNDDGQAIYYYDC